MEDDQQFCLRWNNHQSTLVAVFDTLLENGTLVDCTLAAEGKYLNAHKVVLSACSPYFESLLSQNYDKHPIFILKDVKFQELKAMMDYMYRGEVNISQDQLGALLKAAESLQIKGLSDNKKESEPRKSAPPAPAKSPPPAASTNLPRVQGLTIEQRRGNRSMDEREGSLSPGPRKRKRMRRRSTDDLDNHHDASNSSESHSNPPIQNIPIALPPAPSKLTNADVPEPVETKSEILSRHKISSNNDSEIPQVPIIKEKLETHTELMLEPKAEYVEEMNEDSIEDLTLDDDDVSNLDMSNDGAGPSHGNAGEGSSQGFGGWHMGNQSQDEVFLAAQEAVGAHRDSQGITSAVRVTTSKILYEGMTTTTLSIGENSQTCSARIITGSSDRPISSHQYEKIETLPSSTSSNDLEFETTKNDPANIVLLKLIYEKQRALERTLTTALKGLKVDLSELFLRCNTNIMEVRSVNLPVQIPIDNVNDVYALDEWLKNDTNQLELMKELATVGGKNPQKATTAILKKIFSKGAATKITWAGSDEKLAFKDLHLSKIVINAVKSNKVAVDITEQDIIAHMQNWFANSRDICGGRSERKKKNVFLQI